MSKMIQNSGGDDQESPTTLIGGSAAMRTLRDSVAMAARSSGKVLILGETGVGKEVVARLIHQQGARARRPLVAVNCSGIPETLLESELFGHVRGSFTGAVRDKGGLIQQAHRGTLFLDELGEMSLRMQAVLLRFTETGEVQRVGAESGASRTDVRLITATNRDLRAQIAAGAFREDLYYRLNVIQIKVPPLRARGDDIMLLLKHYLSHAAQTHGLPTPILTPDAAQLLVAYAWPGNVRELRNITERLAVRDGSGPVRPEDLPAEILDGPVTPSIAAAPVRSVEFTHSPAVAIAGGSERVEDLWSRLQAGEDFWTVVRQGFVAQAITREELVTLIDRGLRETGGSYRRMLPLFNLRPEDYKRFHGFLYQQRCNLPVGPYRQRHQKVLRIDSGLHEGVDEPPPLGAAGLGNRGAA
jgi:transcriptional regulator with GAF, ATPase, and Fis domain